VPATTPDTATHPQDQEGEGGNEGQTCHAGQRKKAAAPDAGLTRLETLPTLPRELEIRLCQADHERET
jgi:hypothetical protein